MIFREGWGLEGAKEGENLGSGSPPPAPAAKWLAPPPQPPMRSRLRGWLPCCRELDGLQQVGESLQISLIKSKKKYF